MGTLKTGGIFVVFLAAICEKDHFWQMETGGIFVAFLSAICQKGHFWQIAEMVADVLCG